MYVTSFIDGLHCKAPSCLGGGSGVGCNWFRGCGRSRDVGNADCNATEVVDNNDVDRKKTKLIIKTKNNSSAPSEGDNEKKKLRRIEIMPVELTSCTNNKLVSSSKCLNLEK